ncbi:MAG: DNA cytosine methyltransferase [Rhodopirellula sp.]|nr:DNA cytosine methyltransferase [Rhodopirellula sp.]
MSRQNSQSEFKTPVFRFSTLQKGRALLTAIDLFSGAGGLSQGLRRAGFSVKAAVEFDETSASSFRLNHPRTKIVVDDIRNVTGSRLLRASGINRGELSLLTGCPPCQGFSTLQTRRKKRPDDDLRNDLIFEVLRLIRSIRPKAVVIENVPGLASNQRFERFRTGLAHAGYQYDYALLDAKNFGVPQRRRRLVLVALRDRPIPADWASHNIPIRTVRDAIAHLPAAGSSGDELHDILEFRSAAVIQRIQATPVDGGSRRDSGVECKCHSRTTGYNDVYGRMAWDAVAPTITSGCHNPSKGRFLHPVEHRAITLREAALLQSFPANYRFDLSRGKEHAALQIGNAFPPLLIQPIARVLRGELMDCI